MSEQENQNVNEQEEQTNILENEEEALTHIEIHSNVNEVYVGRVISMKNDYAKTRLRTTKEMSYDEQGLVFNSFIHTAASWAAQVAINKEFLVTIGSKVSFLAPAKIGDIVEFEANAIFSDTSKKQEVRVVGMINEIRVFEGNFSIVILEEHIFKMQKKQMEKQAKESRQMRSEKK